MSFFTPYKRSSWQTWRPPLNRLAGFPPWYHQRWCPLTQLTPAIWSTLKRVRCSPALMPITAACPLCSAARSMAVHLELFRTAQVQHTVHCIMAVSHGTLLPTIHLSIIQSLSVFCLKCFWKKSPRLCLFDQKYSYIVKSDFSLKITIFCLNVYLKCNLFLWLKLNFQHHYSSLQCHMIFQKSF